MTKERSGVEELGIEGKYLESKKDWNTPRADLYCVVSESHYPFKFVCPYYWDSRLVNFSSSEQIRRIKGRPSRKFSAYHWSSSCSKHFLRSLWGLKSKHYTTTTYLKGHARLGRFLGQETLNHWDSACISPSKTGQALTPLPNQAIDVAGDSSCLKQLDQYQDGDLL